MPPGAWTDYQTGKVYQGEKWHDIAAGEIPIILLVKDHTVLPHVKPAQNTGEIDWNNVELKVFSSDNAPILGQFALPDGKLQTLELINSKNNYALKNDFSGGKIKWQINRFPAK